MSEKKEGRDYTGIVLVIAGTAFGWLARKFTSKEVAPIEGTRAEEGTPIGSSSLGETQEESASPQPVDPSPIQSGAPGPAAPFQAEREHAGTLLVLCAFAVAAVAAIVFLVAYWTGGSHLQLGGSMALAAGAFGVGLVIWSHWLMNDEQVTEAREVLPSTPSERAAVSEDFFLRDQLRRRKVLIGMSAGVLGAFAAAVVSLLRSLGKPPGPSLIFTIWKPGDRLVSLEGRPVSINTLQNGSTMSVFPENRIGSVDAQAVLVRVDEQLLRLPEDRTNWAPRGYLAYSRVCTHAGCSVGVYEAETCLLQCPCHQSTFDVLRAAQPTGGPAARPLPQLPLYADAEGNLRAGGDFTEPPGPGFWELR